MNIQTQHTSLSYHTKGEYPNTPVGQIEHNVFGS